MGRCGGLKEGGHHRKAIDVAKRKKAEKSARREAQLTAGQRAAALERLLALDADCDVYLAAPDPEQQQRPLCRSYFRFDCCSNRRCKLSHEHSIADACALASRSDGSEKTDTATDTEEGAPLPAMELIPGGLLRRRRTAPVGPPVPGAAGSFEDLPESAVRDIAAYCPANADLGHVVRSCRYLRQSLLECRDVRERERAAAQIRMEARNERLRVRATAERLRFAVSYAGCHAAAAATVGAAGKAGKKGRQKGRGASANAARRPTLAYDFEDPQAFRAFEQTMSVPHVGTVGEAGGGEAGGDLSSALAANCRVQDNSR